MELRWLIHRNLVKSTRAFWPGTVLDVLLLQGAAFIVGVVQLRERMSGVSVSATFLASNLTDLGWILLSPAVYFAIYYFLTLPRGSFSYFYLIGVLVCWWSSGLSYVISVSTIPPQAQLISTVIGTLILGAFLHGMSPTIRSSRGTFLEVVLGVSYNRWAMEAATIGEFKHYYEYKSNEIIMIYSGIGLCNMDRTLVDNGDDSLSVEEALSFVTLQSDFNADSCDRYSGEASLILFCMGLGLRLFAFGLMYYQNHKQWFQIMGERLWNKVDKVIKISSAIEYVDDGRKRLARK
ncbi:ABC transporter G family member 24 [Tetrabaena socialis]|uniref:ABC transporter G family member 24 n=1 Tax=Tetrabaena socialis TaxID=47790 RepID=A0A2J8AC85_9CHLO|nr:ABC transporter G family member 24 [Tetrabaena socialis]|eukprot:PNH10130.1 ABC transporter G family member 24 [Tetrabaena socialis]